MLYRVGMVQTKNFWRYCLKNTYAIILFLDCYEEAILILGGIYRDIVNAIIIFYGATGIIFCLYASKYVMLGGNLEGDRGKP